MAKLLEKQPTGADGLPLIDLTFPAERLFEYQWPRDDPSAEFYLLQEQVAEYLGINGVRSFQRKYPTLQRRPVLVEERDYLFDEGAIDEQQFSQGLTALRSDDVCQLMMREHPDEYRRYARVLQDRELKKRADEQKALISSTTKRPGGRGRGGGGDSLRVQHAWKRASQQATDFNAKLARDRETRRCAYYDFQTNLIHYPKNALRKPPPREPDVERTWYPVALVPGQYQETYVRYEREELKAFPLNTALVPPPASEKPPPPRVPDPVQVPVAMERKRVLISSSTPATPGVKRRRGRPRKRPATPCQLCGICRKGKESNPNGVPEELVSCSKCGNSGHPTTCLEMSDELLAVVRTYAWQCIECKTCSKCEDPHDDDKMLFCDRCDRGYHTYCVGLESLPQGQWLCKGCAPAEKEKS